MALCDCSVVILAHCGVEFTRANLTNLLAAEDKPAELFLVDNASTDSTPELFRAFIPRLEAAGVAVTTWRNTRNDGCSLARNQAWERAACRYTVFLDSDAAVCTSRWLSGLVGEMEARPNVGILGPKMIYPYQPHPIQCAGVGLTPEGRVWFRGRGQARDTPRFQQFCTVPMLISACWIMRTDLRESVGYLDELFHPVQYEDLDLCIRAWEAGLQVAYTPQVEMYHFEGITTESFGAEEYRKNIARNALKFRRKWHHKFADYGAPADPDDLRWRSREEMRLRPELDLGVA